MKVPFFTPVREYLNYQKELDHAIQQVLLRGDFILGEEVGLFEQEAIKYLEAPYAVGVASGTDALVIASDLLDFRDGAEVLTPTFTFFASASCIARLGGRPVFVDINEETLQMDLNAAERKITKKTKGILPVHLFNQPVPMEPLLKMAKAYDLAILEDAAEAWGMECKIGDSWKKAGTIGDIGIYSFFPTKTLGGYGDGGLIVTSNPDLAQKARWYRVHGAKKKYYHEYLGYNSRLDTVQAAVLRVKLNHIQEAIEKRAKHAEHYMKRLSVIPEVRIPIIPDNVHPVYYVFNILVIEKKRDALIQFLKEREVGTTVYYPLPLHLQPCFSYLGYKEGDFPRAEGVSEQILALPLFPELTDDEVDYVCDCIEEFFR